MEHYVHFVADGRSHDILIGQVSSNPFHAGHAVNAADISGEMLIQQYEVSGGFPESG
jgi:hypothetical protein